MRDYIAPKIPRSWTGEQRTYANMMQDVLDELHMPVKESWLSTELLEKLRQIPDKQASQTQNYSEQIVDTGLKWIDGSAIKRVTQVLTVAANVAMSGDSIANLGALIRVEGFVLTSAGACYPVGNSGSTAEVNVWKNAGGDSFRVLSTIGGTAYITVYYIEGEAPVTQDVWTFFNDGYTKDADEQTIAWGANQLPRPNNATQGYTAYGYATLTQVETRGNLYMYNGTGTNVFYNAHVCTAELIHIPSTATKLNVTVARGPNSSQFNIALLPDNAPNSMDVSNGGKISTFFTATTTPTVYSLSLDEGMAGTDDYRIVVNYRGKSDLYRTLSVSKVEFE